MFPVLAAVCSQVKGVSELSGIKNLRYKESDRVSNTTELLKNCGIECSVLANTVKINGHPNTNQSIKELKSLDNQFNFDPDHDHRMAMAAEVMNAIGFKINILNQDVVKKSFPSFWQVSNKLINKE